LRNSRKTGSLEHLKEPPGSLQIKFCDLDLTAEEREEFDMNDRGLDGEKRLAREGGVVQNGNPFHPSS
jgi:hypothetical protein